MDLARGVRPFVYLSHSRQRKAQTQNEQGSAHHLEGRLPVLPTYRFFISSGGTLACASPKRACCSAVLAFFNTASLSPALAASSAALIALSAVVHSAFFALASLTAACAL